MKHLAIQTVERPEEFSIFENGTCLSTVKFTEKQSISDDLPELVEAEIDLLSLVISDLEFITVVVGPGSFTGIKSGLAYAEGLSIGLKIPLVAMSSLEVLAWSEDNDKVVAMIDARNQRAYYQIFTDGKDSEIGIDEIGKILKSIDGSFLITGSAGLINQTYINSLGKFKISKRVDVSSETSGILGYKKFLANNVEDAESIKPLYISQPSITLTAKNHGK